MRVFLLDLWLDLREKRLAPIALALLAAIVIVPIVLAKGTKPAPAPPTPTTAAAAPAAPVIQSNPQAGAVESKLQTFSSRDPFEPTSKPAAVGTGTAGAATGQAGTGTAGTGGTTGTGTTGSGTTGGGGTTGSTGTGNTGTGTGNTGNTTGGSKKVFYTYTVDIRFGPPGNEAMTKGVQRLELIPSQDNPKIVFLGVTTTGKTAVFLVDSNLGVDTNGKCKPSADNCQFLYLRPDGTHDTAQLTDQDGNSFRLHLLKIHRILLSASNGTSGSSGGSGNSGKTGSSNRSPAFTGKADSNNQNTAPGETPPGEPDQPFAYRGFFADGEGQ